MWLNDTQLVRGRELCVQEGREEEIMILTSYELSFIILEGRSNDCHKR